jgi:hypothetical protein
VRAGGGKSKGATWEREISVALSRWISSGTQEDVYWRSALSGGRATVGFKKGKNHASQVGDLSCIHPIGQTFIDAFAVEAKFYADLEYKGLLTGKGKLVSFWVEINKQASRYKKQPVLIVRQNRMKPHICLDYCGKGLLGFETDPLLISIPQNMYIWEFDQFLQLCKPYI